MLEGFQTSWDLPPELLSRLTGELACTMTRLDYQASVADAVKAIKGARAAGYQKTLLLLHDSAWVPEIAKEIPPNGVDISGPNEPDQRGWFGQWTGMTPVKYSAWLDAAVPRCRAAGFPLWAPVVSGTHTRGLAYVHDLWPTFKKYQDVNVDIHCYRPDSVYVTGDVTTPEEGSMSRLEEIQKLLTIIGDRPWGVSEVGYSTSKAGGEMQQAELWTKEIVWWRALKMHVPNPPKFLVGYQFLRSGSDAYGVLEGDPFGAYRLLPAAHVFALGAPTPEPPQPQPQPPTDVTPSLPLDGAKTVALGVILNFRDGGCDKGFEWRPWNWQGVDETCYLVPTPDGWWAVLSPNKQAWLSVQPDGKLEGRPSSTIPGAWECFTFDGVRVTERPKDGVTRALVQFVITTPTAVQPVEPISRLHLDGTRLLTASNKPIFLRGADAFLAYEIFLRFGPDALRTTFDQLKTVYHVNCLRWWMMCVNVVQNEFQRPPFDPATFPGYVDRFSEFLAFCKAYGFWSYVGFGPDIGLMHPDLGWQQNFWDTMRPTLEADESVFAVEFQNEAAAKSYNKLAAGFQTRSPNLLWVGTSYSDSDPAYASGTFPADDLGGGSLGDLHPARHYWSHALDCTAVNNVYFKANKGLIIGEPDRYGWRGTVDPYKANISGAATKVGAVASFFHSMRGERCEPFDEGETKPCADAWFSAL